MPPVWDPAQDTWLTGFADGEGTFVITRSGSQVGNRRRAWTPRFAISLRADDTAVLAALRSRFGGSISTHAKRAGTHPIATWTIAGKRDLALIVDYFDRFPLRSKKARDYAIWRSAALLYIECSNSADIVEQMEPLRDALNGGRLLVAGADEPAALPAEHRL